MVSLKLQKRLAASVLKVGREAERGAGWASLMQQTGRVACAHGSSVQAMHSQAV